ncbi:hypothetical protein D9613_006856 [Agrocybe pediades]|uniref:Dystroglycan-type cadherin-like domain-containing protein n=1 Tax=Agrocybe pediades TaxID=84607 RepID=A0A8H4QGK7_9AGAR|nr:hypothetical protein D9613_006856 [Agrocybe pediades]
MTFILLCFFTYLAVALATTTSVSVLQSLDKQLVQVARLGQPYFWTFSPYTFNSSDGPLTYTTSALPTWLSFDNSSRTFQGTPAAGDEGYPEITVTAHAYGSSTSSRFTICVTHLAPPTVNIPLSMQLQPTNPSMSSLFFLRPNSAIATQNPAVRIPRKWSFSIGLDSNTIVSSDSDVFYELRLANGSDIPNYMSFNSQTATLDGVVPSGDGITQPSLLPFNLHASDQEGYTATILPFDIVVADHELSSTRPNLPTINVTTETPFFISLLSSADFTGVLVDDAPIQSFNISMLDIDVSGYSSWLRYDIPSRTLSGNPSANVTAPPLLPVTLTTSFNQTLKTQVYLALVESYFVMPELPALHVSKGDDVQFDLAQFFSHSFTNPSPDSTNISVVYEPTSAANWLRFDEVSSNLTGTVPSEEINVDHVTITFTAYSHETHSTSHTSLTIYLPSTNNTQSFAPNHPSGLSNQARRKLVLALALTFGILGGLCSLAGVLAIIRQCARTTDAAVVTEEGRQAFSEKDRKWYGLTLSPRGTRITEKVDSALFHPSPARRSPKPNSPRGLDLQRVAERSHHYSELTGETVTTPGIMPKREFLRRIKATVRQVSNKYARKGSPPSIKVRPAIGKPILISSSRLDPQGDMVIHDSSSNPFDDAVALSRPESAFISGSPSASTAEQSIPRRRADFATPRNPAQVHFNEGLLVRQISMGSMGTNSYISGRSGLSVESYADSAHMGPPTRPRLVPFTSSTRVPVPALPVHTQGSNFAGTRVTSQRAKVCKAESKDVLGPAGMKANVSSDGLSMGIHYVRSLGADQLQVNGSSAPGSSPTLSNVRSSFTSLESSHVGNRSGTEEVMKVLIRAGERFKFRVAIRQTPENSTAESRDYDIKLTSGQPLPAFIHADLSEIHAKGVLELSGIATFHDLGEKEVGVYAGHEGICIAVVVIEVVVKR